MLEPSSHAQLHVAHTFSPFQSNKSLRPGPRQPPCHHVPIATATAPVPWRRAVSAVSLPTGPVLPPLALHLCHRSQALCRPRLLSVRCLRAELQADDAHCRRPFLPQVQVKVQGRCAGSKGCCSTCTCQDRPRCHGMTWQRSLHQLLFVLSKRRRSEAGRRCKSRLPVSHDQDCQRRITCLLAAETCCGLVEHIRSRLLRPACSGDNEFSSS